jgi:hypothetical protein
MENARMYALRALLECFGGPAFGFRQRNNVRVGWREIDELGHAGGMLIAEMAVNFHGRRAAVFVAGPSGDGGDFNAAFDARRSSFPCFPSVERVEQKRTKETKGDLDFCWCIRRDLNPQTF